MIKKFVTYTEFGAKGDGITDDFVAILTAHEYANKHSLPVITNDNKTYLIRNTLIDSQPRYVPIMTNVHWGSSKFIIDDTDIDFFDGTGAATSPVFKVISEYDPMEIKDPGILSKLSGIGEKTKRLDLSLGYPALVVIYNDDHDVYHRYGATYISRGGQCSPMHEILLLDANGNIDVSTPLMFEYDHITRITVIRCDISPITIKGGIFTTRASNKNAYIKDTNSRAKYFLRNIVINRSYTTLEGVEHYVEGEVPLSVFMEDGLCGAHYFGFYYADFANEITLKNCVLTARTSYRWSTYEFYANHINKIYLIGCTQSNFTLTEDGEEMFSMSPSKLTNWPRCWGIGGTNFCKNMEYTDCKLSRFDAHQGLYNGKVKNCTINFMEIIGKGELVFEGIDWYSPAPGRIYNSFAYLRDDYGCTWDGTITFKDCTMHVSSGDAYVFFYSYTNWDYGYRCHFPNLLIDNMKIVGLSDGAKLHIVNEHGSVLREPDMHRFTTRKTPLKTHDGTDDPANMRNANPIIPPKSIKILNNTYKYKFILPKWDFFEGTEKIGVYEEEI